MLLEWNVISILEEQKFFNLFFILQSLQKKNQVINEIRRESETIIMGRPKIKESKSAANKKYCERYRAKNLSKLRIKERERKKAAREYEKYVHPEKYQERLKNDRIRAREYRARKKAEKQREDEAQCTNQVTPKSSSSTSQESTSVFTIRQSLNRSVLRAERYLPNSPRKKSEVLSDLAKKYELRIQYGNKRGRKTKTLTKEQDDWLLDVLERSDMTYTNPGRKDHIYMGKIDGEKVYEQKRYLLWSLRDAWEAINGIGFKEKFDEPLSFSQFYRFIKSKKQIILQKDIPDTSCLCEICENASLMARALKKSKSGHPLNAHDIVERYTCETNSVSCITNKCLECTPHKILQSWDNVSDESEESKSSSDDNDTDDFVPFSTWVRETGKIKKVVKSISKDQFYKDWYQTVGALKEHIHRKRIQVESYNLQKAELKEGEALVHVDYSESYKNKQQNEIQSAYFGQSSFSLFTACVYYRDENGEFTKLPICVISESNDHSRAAALTCVDLVVKEVEKHIALSKIILWSDGCASQFRSRFVFKLLAHYRPDLEMSWFYNGAHHGKGPMDGIGGTVKNVVSDK